MGLPLCGVVDWVGKEAQGGREVQAKGWDAERAVPRLDELALSSKCRVWCKHWSMF